jgi:glutathione S-transferase
MITVHHLEDSRSQRVLWLLEELGLAYEIVRYARDPKTMLAPPELRKVHPLGLSPVVQDGDRVVVESGAILEYLSAKAGGALRPDAASDEGLRCTTWLHYAEGSLMPLLLVRLVLDELSGKNAPFLARPIGRAIGSAVRKTFLDARTAHHLRYIEGELGRRPWFAGEALSIADVQMCFPLQAAKTRLGLEAYPNILAWLAKIEARPAWKRSLERGGPYAYA